jgi:crotonobetaine/carnitine-CoA ligase
LDRQSCTVHELLEHHATRNPNMVLVRFDSGEVYTAASLLEEVRLLAVNLQHLGVRKNDTVLTWLPNGPLAVSLHLALNYAGAIVVPINTAYRGNLLAHVIANSGARLMIADGKLIERLTDVSLAALEILLVAGAERIDSDLLRQEPADLLQQQPLEPAAPVILYPHDTAAVIYTSGTTGPSKGVLCSYLHLYTSAMEFRHVGPGDTNLVALPMFHVGGILGLWFALVHGGCAAYVERFSTTKFWPTVRALGATSVGLLGAMVQYLMAQPVSAGEKEHPVQRAVIAPFGDDALAFGERFGIEVHTEFNMTELSVPLWGGPNPTARGTCGKPRPGVNLRLVDARGEDVGIGETGELLVHVDDPFTISHGYHNDPVATAATWRDGWFHTGDLFTRDADDNYFFIDRAKDALRRKGENISSFEVEAELLAHPGIREAAVVAVPGDGGEDEVLAVLVADGVKDDLQELVAFLGRRLPHFMVPRYFRFVDSLPKTPTQKIEKHQLRQEGLTSDTLDREGLGVTIDKG